MGGGDASLVRGSRQRPENKQRPVAPRTQQQPSGEGTLQKSSARVCLDPPRRSIELAHFTSAARRVPSVVPLHVAAPAGVRVCPVSPVTSYTRAPMMIHALASELCLGHLLPSEGARGGVHGRLNRRHCRRRRGSRGQGAGEGSSESGSRDAVERGCACVMRQQSPRQSAALRLGNRRARRVQHPRAWIDSGVAGDLGAMGHGPAAIAGADRRGESRATVAAVAGAIFCAPPRPQATHRIPSRASLVATRGH